MSPGRNHALFGIVCLGVLAFTSIPVHSASTPVYLELTVLGPDGQALPQFEVMMHSDQHGYISWQKGSQGKINFRSHGVQTLRTATDHRFQVIVRAPNLAPAILHLENPASGAWIRETVQLTLGRLIDLIVHTADGSPLPKSVTPLVVYTDFAWRVRMNRMPQNQRPGRVFDFEMSKVQRMGEGRYQFRVPDKDVPFLLSIHEPGFMRLLESEIFTEDRLADSSIAWHLPAPAKVQLRFALPDENGPPPYRLTRASVSTQIPAVGKYYTVWLQEYETLSFDATIADLAPGRHMVRTLLMPPEPEDGTKGETSTPMVFHDQVMLDLAAGQEEMVSLNYVPLDPNAWRGDDTMSVTIKRYKGMPATDEPFTLSYNAPHYGGVIVLKDKLNAQGQFRLPGVRTGADGPEFFLFVGDNWFRRIRIAEHGHQEFEFTLAPQVGDCVPDISMLDIATNKSVSFSSLRGGIIYLEFWATWCGPCKVPMIKLNQVARKRCETWKGRVHILAVSIDDSAEIVQNYVTRRAWTAVRHLWAGGEPKDGFESKAARAFGLRGVPTAMLIDTNGRIVWRGHPKDADCEAQIDGLLKQAGEEQTGSTIDDSHH